MCSTKRARYIRVSHLLCSSRTLVLMLVTFYAQESGDKCLPSYSDANNAEVNGWATVNVPPATRPSPATAANFASGGGRMHCAGSFISTEGVSNMAAISSPLPKEPTKRLKQTMEKQAEYAAPAKFVSNIAEFEMEWSTTRKTDRLR
mmetsp:Transcript_18786/g.30458  ORF Transcript_18786/g.30458 Transcript_18786/m.30458 type:complete len:147 (-) Transcript_18786:104-544(-)